MAVARYTPRDQAVPDLLTAPPIQLGPARLVPDPSGALWWPDQATLIVADLHLEKGSSFARRGTLLPPYDTAATLARLADLRKDFREARRPTGNVRFDASEARLSGKLVIEAEQMQ